MASLRPRLTSTRRSLVVAAIAGVLALTASGAAAAPRFSEAPFSTSAEARAEALVCPAGLADATVDPVLLIHGTTVSPEHNFSWNWQRILDADEIPWCTVALADVGMADIQDSAEHVVDAIRTMSAEAGRPIDIVGHSQGGMIGRWSLKWWPDTRAMVDDFIGLAPDNHGTDTAEPICEFGCAPSFHQQRTSSAFMAALNDGDETFAGIDYTAIYTHYDGVVTPNFDESGSSSLRTGRGVIANIATQDVCPNSTADHLSIGTYDPVGYALARDALDNDGPASAERIDLSLCAQLLMPGVDPLTFAADYGQTLAFLADTTATYPQVDEEPPLRCYVTGSCTTSADAAALDQPSPNGEVLSTQSATPSLPATGGRSGLLAFGLFAGGAALAGRAARSSRRLT